MYVYYLLQTWILTWIVADDAMLQNWQYVDKNVKYMRNTFYQLLYYIVMYVVTL